MITAECVTLTTRGGPVLLVWPADVVSWRPATQMVAFRNPDGVLVEAGNGASVVVGGSGDSFEESGRDAEQWRSQVDWVNEPSRSCPMELRWYVGALSR